MTKNSRDLSKLLAQFGYSKYALESEVVTEEMLDEMFPEERTDLTESHPIISSSFADGKPFVAKPTLVSPYN